MADLSSKDYKQDGWVSTSIGLRFGSRLRELRKQRGWTQVRGFFIIRLQSAANTLVSDLFRKGRGVRYEQIASDVAKRVTTEPR